MYNIADVSSYSYITIFINFINKININVNIYSAPGVDHNELVGLAEKHFSGLGSTYEPGDVLEPCRFTGSEVNNKQY